MFKYLNNPHVVFINFLSDGGFPYTCNDWGNAGQANFPIIVDDELNYSHVLGDWFGISNLSPRNVFLDHNFNYYAITEDIYQVEQILDSMLENID